MSSAALSTLILRRIHGSSRALYGTSRMLTPERPGDTLSAGLWTIPPRVDTCCAGVHVQDLRSRGVGNFFCGTNTTDVTCTSRDNVPYRLEEPDVISWVLPLREEIEVFTTRIIECCGISPWIASDPPQTNPLPTSSWNCAISNGVSSSVLCLMLKFGASAKHRTCIGPANLLPPVAQVFVTQLRVALDNSIPLGLPAGRCKVGELYSPRVRTVCRSTSSLHTWQRRAGIPRACDGVEAGGP